MPFKYLTFFLCTTYKLNYVGKHITNNKENDPLPSMDSQGVVSCEESLARSLSRGVSCKESLARSLLQGDSCEESLSREE